MVVIVLHSYIMLQFQLLLLMTLLLFVNFAIIDIGPLIICVLFISFPKYVYPAAPDLAPVATEYAAPEWLCNIISLARYSNTASRCVAQ